MLRHLALVLLLLSACGHPSTSGSNSNWIKCTTSAECSTLGEGASCIDGACAAATASESDATTLPACTWSPSFAKTDADVNDGRCVAARTLLSCTSDAGISSGCISDDPMECPGPNPVIGVSFTCHDQCEPQEYGMVCGGPPPAAIPEPPAGCRGMGPIPSGAVFYCCPCGQ